MNLLRMGRLPEWPIGTHQFGRWMEPDQARRPNKTAFSGGPEVVCSRARRVLLMFALPMITRRGPDPSVPGLPLEPCVKSRFHGQKL